MAIVSSENLVVTADVTNFINNIKLNLISETQNENNIILFF